MTIWRVNNSTQLGGEVCAQWTTGHAYSLGARVVCRLAYGTVARRAFVYECTTAGTSHGTTEPTWPTSGTVSDNDVVWTCRSPGDGTWDNASCFLQYITQHAGCVAGDLIYIDDGHNETLCDITTISGFNNIIPLKIICVDKNSDSLSVGAIVQSGVAWYNGQVTFSLHGYAYGVKFYKAAAGYVFTIGSETINRWVFESDANTTEIFKIETSVANAHISMQAGNSLGSRGVEVIIRNGAINFVNVESTFNLGKGSRLILDNIKLLAESTNLLVIEASKVHIKNSDISALCAGATNRYLISFASNAFVDSTVLVSSCKLPSGAGFALLSGSFGSSVFGSIKVHNSSGTDVTYGLDEVHLNGTNKHEIVILRSGGSTPISIKMASNALVHEGYTYLESPPIYGWTDSTTEKTFTVEVIHDSATALQNDEIWLELEYPLNNTSAMGKRSSSRCGTLTAPADIPDSSEAWTTTGLTNPNTRKLSVTVTPGKSGPVIARICLAKASTTVYVDPMVVES